MNERGFEHSIDCTCGGCERIRAMLRRNVKKGKVHLVGIESDKKKILDNKIVAEVIKLNKKIIADRKCKERELDKKIKKLSKIKGSGFL